MNQPYMNHVIHAVGRLIDNKFIKINFQQGMATGKPFKPGPGKSLRDGTGIYGAKILQ